MLKRRRYQRRAQSRLTRHKIATMPTHTIRNLLTYKGNWDDFPVAHISENGTSVMCHRCGGKGKRLFQGLFTCPRCGLEYNADANGAINEAGFASTGLRYLNFDLAPELQRIWYNEMLAMVLSMKGVVGFWFLVFKDRGFRHRYSQFEEMGLVRFDGSLKQSYYAVKQLVGGLTQVRASTDSDGMLSVRLLPGNYTVKVFGMVGRIQIARGECSGYRIRPGEASWRSNRQRAWWSQR